MFAVAAILSLISSFGLVGSGASMDHVVNRKDQGRSKPLVVLCLHNETMLADVSREVMLATLTKLQNRLTVKIQFACDSLYVVKITFAGFPSGGHPHDALAATRVDQRRVLPDITIFWGSLLAFVAPASSAEQGRASAAVLYHELQHYLRQVRGHAPGGLCGAFVTRDQLLRSDW